MELTPAEDIGYVPCSGCSSGTIRRGRSTRGADDHAVLPLQRDLFTYSLVLGKIYGCDGDQALYLIGFWSVTCSARSVGPLLRHHRSEEDDCRDYILSGLLLALSAILFNAGVLNSITQTLTCA